MGIDFPNPKRTDLIKRIVNYASLGEENAIILDSFAGSGTTAHAVLSLNKEDGGNRKFISLNAKIMLDTITAERVRRVINGVPDARDDALREGLGGSFTYCTLGKPIEVETMLTGEALPSYSALAANLLYTTAGVSVGSGALESKNEDGLFYMTVKTTTTCSTNPTLNICAATLLSSIWSAQNAFKMPVAKAVERRSSTQRAITSVSANSHRWALSSVNSPMPCTKDKVVGTLRVP